MTAKKAGPGKPTRSDFEWLETVGTTLVHTPASLRRARRLLAWSGPAGVDGDDRVRLLLYLWAEAPGTNPLPPEVQSAPGALLTWAEAAVTEGRSAEHLEVMLAEIKRCLGAGDRPADEVHLLRERIGEIEMLTIDKAVADAETAAAAGRNAHDVKKILAEARRRLGEAELHADKTRHVQERIREVEKVLYGEAAPKKTRPRGPWVSVFPSGISGGR